MSSNTRQETGRQIVRHRSTPQLQDNRQYAATPSASQVSLASPDVSRVTASSIGPSASQLSASRPVGRWHEFTRQNWEKPPGVVADPRWLDLPQNLRDMVHEDSMREAILKALKQPAHVGLDGYTRVGVNLPGSGRVQPRYQFFTNGHFEGMRQVEIDRLTKAHGNDPKKL
eukprot:gnl/TRDRNA2_/TRDRNA2_189183_c0_seq1.p1 gnl/TRDRNA2_/TRDRNA2_189183_c0~~gnl/TRDRNA2_/TRDRNA2_189183_c0_seq1.p1  ORF type:complete len:171 (+),score=24.19 gnl/TRDRNA2_/TRDRNA2_189183_c0_seq1:82-594(+)